MKRAEILVLLIVVVLLYWLVSSEDETATSNITLESKCELMLRSQHDLPKHVIEYCKNILEKENDD